MDLLIVTGKTLFFYFFILVMYRFMGKREIGQLGVIDLIVSILIAELVAISIENFKDTILLTVIPIIVLVILEILLAYLSIKCKGIRNFLDGKPTFIISEGRINYKVMVNLRYSMDDLLFQLRQKGIKSIEEVEYAVVEPNGKLSLFPYNKLRLKSSYPMALIIDGIIQEDTLEHLKYTKEMIYEKLAKNNLVPEDIFYAFMKKHKLYYITCNDIKKP